MGQAESNESAAVKRQAEGFANPMYRMLDLGGGGLFLELGKRSMLTGNTTELDEAIRFCLALPVHVSVQIQGPSLPLQ